MDHAALGRQQLASQFRQGLAETGEIVVGDRHVQVQPRQAQRVALAAQGQAPVRIGQPAPCRSPAKRPWRRDGIHAQRLGGGLDRGGAERIELDLVFHRGERAHHALAPQEFRAGRQARRA